LSSVVRVRADVVGVDRRRTKMLERLLLALLDDDPAHPRVVGLRRSIVGAWPAPSALAL
jgi:hypothetical protein